MFQAIISNSPDSAVRLRKLGEAFYRSKNRSAALLCFDHSFSEPPQLHSMNCLNIADILDVFLKYSRLLYDFAFNSDPRDAVSVQKVFGFLRHGEDTFLIPEGTFLHLALCEDQHPALARSTDCGCLISGWELAQFYPHALGDRLRRRVSSQNEMCRETRAFSAPCLSFMAFGNCYKDTDCPDEHISAHSLTVAWFNTRIRIHMQQILIYQTLHSVVSAEEMAWQRRWSL